MVTREAELGLLSVAIVSPIITDTIKITPEDFQHPAHGQLWRAITELHDQGVIPDVVTISQHLRLPDHLAQQMAVLLLDVATYDGILSNAEHYADQVIEASQRRHVASVLTQLRIDVDDTTIPLADSLAKVEREIVRDTAMEALIEDAMTLDEFCDQPFGEIDWVIPDMLARDDRLVLTGIEGFGKSVLLRSIAVMVACGLDPFTLQSIPAKRVLVVDCENPKRIMAEKFSAIRNVAKVRGRTADERLWIKRFPQGMDLAKPKDRLDLHQLCQVYRPDLLVIGPAYKLYVGGAQQREEDLARIVTATLDGLRETFGFALILEHHSPHGTAGAGRSVRPIGSSLWLRWPEFGFGLAPQDDTEIEDRCADVKHWRGARDERRWPKELYAGNPARNEMPWVDRSRLGY